MESDVKIASRVSHGFIGASLAAASFIGLRSFVAHNVLFSPKRYSDTKVSVLAKRTTLIKYQSSQGSQTAYFISPAGQLTQLIVIFPGNATTADKWLDLAERIPRELSGAGALLIDYPGFGTNEGDPFPESIQESAGKAVSELCREVGVSNFSIGLIGHSMGCGAALRFALSLENNSSHRISQITLMAPFSRLSDVAPWARPFIRFDYDNVQALKTLNSQNNTITPVVIYHGSEDALVPPEMSKELAEIPGVTRIEIQGADHNDIKTSCMSNSIADIINGH